ncbi:hypothetical protein AM493_17160 [Flavobacterium akiainvivens]|uniref:Insecticide toxin TcdB middle/N-terminal domain-containing protein n=2 Tax=Flavobacterium akiainvivens TaxID=1202724 RepID=A0A0M8MKA5_9FLAO|nr:hypothetical protein AM493_17160 [Flavobacterium akiainvivens]
MVFIYSAAKNNRVNTGSPSNTLTGATENNQDMPLPPAGTATGAFNQSYRPVEVNRVFHALEGHAIVGADELSGVENPYDNFFTLQLPEDVNLSNYEVVMSYDLYGVNGAAQTTKRINNQPAYGGKMVTLSGQWSSVSEVLPLGYIKAGKNEIYFNRRAKEQYRYQVKNLKIELKDAAAADIALPGSLAINGQGNLYLVATVTNPEVKEVEALGEKLQVCEGVIEKVFENVPLNLKNLELTYTTLRGKQHKNISIITGHEAPQYNFEASVLAPGAVQFSTADFSNGTVSYDNLSISAEHEKLAAGSRVMVSGLNFKDLKALNPDVDNVTLGSFAGYRIQKLDFPDSVPAKLHLKYDPDKIPNGYTAQDIRTFYYNAEQRTWQQLSVDSLDIKKNEVVVSTYENDTDYINGVIKVPDSPETSSFAPTTMSDIKVSDPATGVVSIAPPTPNSTGTANTSFPIKLPQGRHGQQPSLQVSYNSEAGNGWMGVGWNLSTPAVTLNTKWGAPLFNGSYETEMYSLNGSELVLKTTINGSEVYTSPNRDSGILRGAADRQFYERKEGAYQHIVRKGNSPSNYFWIITDKQGNKSFYGGVTALDTNAVMRDAANNVTHWALRRTQDTYGNYVDYNYFKANAAVGTSAISGQEFYISSIEYTKSSASEPNFYRVQFIRNTYSTTLNGQSNNVLNRTDVSVNARNGIIQITDDLLTEVHVSLVQSGTPTIIRKYRFDYVVTAFQKNQIEEISEFDSQGNLFYSNTLEYYPMDNTSIISGQTTYSGTSDDVQSLLPNLVGGSPTGSALGTSTASGFSFGLRAGLGYGIKVWDIGTSVGGSFNYSKNSQEGKISFVDINGDGLPDKVVSNGSGRYYRPNTGTGFGSPSTIVDLSELSKSKSRTVGAGVDASLGPISAGKSWSKTKTETDSYFSDFNGDGLPDVVTGGRVKFNVTGPTGDPMQRKFDNSPGQSENNIAPGIISQDLIPDLNLETLAMLREQNPQFDHVKLWEAPYDGVVNITGIARLLAKNTQGSLDNRFRITIERAGATQITGTAVLELGNESIAFNTVTTTGSVSMNKNNITVAKGDKLMFRIHNLNYGFGGKVEWNPIITYSSLTNITDTNVTDDNAKNLKVYNSFQDYIVNNDEGISLNASGALSVNFNLGSYPVPSFSDNLTFTIKISRSNDAGQEFTPLTWQATYNHLTGVFTPANPNITYSTTLNSTYKYSVMAYVESTSNVKWEGLKWKPTVSHTSLGTLYVPVNYYNYDDNVYQSDYWINANTFPVPSINNDSSTAMMTFSHNLLDQNFSSAMSAMPNLSYLPVHWLVKQQIGTTTTVLHRRTIYIYKNSTGSIILAKTQGGSPILSTDTSYWQYNLSKGLVQTLRSSSARLYSAFYIDQKELADADVNIKFGLIDTQAANYTFANIELDKPYFSRIVGQFGRPHRGWNQFLYNGGIRFEHDDEGEIDPNSTPQTFAGPIDLTIFDMQAQEDQLEQYQNTDPEDMEIDDSPVRFATYKEKNEVLSYDNASVIGALYGLNTAGTVLAATIGRFGEANLYDVYIDPATITTATPGVYPGLRQRSESKGKAVSAGATYANGTESEATSKVLNQYIDLNGDRYPDIVTEKRIQYTDMLGALSTKQETNNFASGDSSKDWTAGVTIPCIQPNSTDNSSGRTTGNKTNTNVNSGINTGNGESSNANQWVDINGDGLPDKIKIAGTTIQVELNTGYGFTAPFNWFTNGSDYLTNTRRNTSVSVSGGGSLGLSSSLSFGVGATTSTANAETFLNDVNGDGLPDLIYRTSPTAAYNYRLNTGEGFSSQVFSFYSSDLERNVSTSANVFGSYTFGFPIPLFIITLKVVITPSLGANTTLSNTNRTLQDINGDGLVDVVETGSGNGSLTARLNQTGKANLLKKVNTPLGGSWTINYTRNGNTYDMPQSKWTLTSIDTHDGFTADSNAGFGPDVTKTGVIYANPKQDRREREFLGYGTVTVQEKDANGTVYRTAVTTYHNENYYVSGLQKGSILYDSSMQMLSSESSLYNLLSPDTPVVNFAANAQGNYFQADLVANANALLDKSRLFIAVAKATSTSYEDGQGLTTEKEFLSYSTLGNITQFRDNGEGEDDAYKTVIDYHSSISGIAYSPGYPQKISVYKNAGNILMRERQATYYANTGGLYEITTKLNSTDYGKVRLAYDSFGNLTQVSDLENKNSANTNYYTKTIAYETILKTYPATISNSFGESSAIEQYNYFFGVPLLVKDVNSQYMRTRIDNRGRVIEVTGPNEMALETASGGAWTIRTDYKGVPAISANIAPGTYMLNITDTPTTLLTAFRAVAPGTATPTTAKHYAVTRHFDPEYATGITTTNQMLTVSLIDGFGKALQVKKSHQTGATSKWMVSGFQEKDAFGRVLKSYLPVVNTTGFPTTSTAMAATLDASAGNYVTGAGLLQPPVITTYDAKDRPKTVQQPGETQAAQMVYAVENGMYAQKLTNELGQTLDTYTDIRGRQRRSLQNGEITTTFEYNAINELMKVIDNEGFATEYLYDLAGRKTETHHPDRGVVTFKYDKASRMTEQSNSNLLPGGQKINYFYNYSRMERIEYPQNPQNNVTYTYGAPGNQLAIDERAIGRLLTQEDATGKQLFSYGRMGELVEHLRSVAVADYQSYWFFTQWKYDSWNRVQEITYPDQEVVTYAYNKAGAIQGINSQMAGIAGGAAQPVVSNILYNDFGERVSITHGSGSGATTTTYSYDTRRRMNGLSHAFFNYGITKNYAYDALSNITDITTATPQNSLPANGRIGGPIRHHYEYDDYNRLEHAEGVYTGANDLTTPYLRTTYSLDMEYNTDHTIKKKTQLQEQGWVNAYSDNTINDLRPVQKTSYILDYAGYGDAAFVSGPYGYQQPHAPRTITETPSWVTNPAPDDPRIKQKKILYDANGNQTEVKEVLGEVETSLRKNIWDEANRLKAVNLKPDDPTAHPIAIYTYDAGGARTIRYNYDRIDVSSNATEVGQARKDNVMIYPSGLIMGKAARMRKEGGAADNTLVYTKHYYIGSERVSAKTGTLAKFGDYPQTLVNSKMGQMATVGTSLMRTPSTVTQQEATATVVAIHNSFGVTPPAIPAVQQEPTMTYGAHDQSLLNSYYFHPDHLGSSSYITNSSGVVCQHMEYLPFGETLVDEHLNSNNSPFKYNGKELDEETGNYYYGARYYDPKLSIFISVDPLADKYPGISPYAYCFNNPINLIDPTGMEPNEPSNDDPVKGGWYNTSGKLVYDTSLNDGKGGYTADATRNDKRLGNALQTTETGRKQFDKLVNSSAPITVEIDLSSKAKKDNGGYQMGLTVSNYDSESEYDMETGKTEVVNIKINSASIKINVANIEAVMSDISSGTIKNDKLKDLNMDEMLAVVFGHEIDHTTVENARVMEEGGDKEAGPTATGYQIADEIKKQKKH